MAEPSVQSVERAFALLEQLALHPRGMALTELAEATALHKSTVHRLLGSLFSLGYVVKDSASGRYRLTFKLLTLSNGILDGIDVLSCAKPHLDRLSEETGEIVHLMVPEGPDGVYIYKSEPPLTQGQMRSRVGLRAPLACTAAGKAILATLPQEEVGRLWTLAPPAPLTRSTLTQQGTLLAQLREIRARGWAVDDEENEVGVKCIGAAIPDYRGRALAAMSISANAARMTPQLLESLIPKLLQCKEDICRDMGF